VQLLRAGRPEAARDIRLASATGLLVTDGSNIRFTPPSVATVVAESATAARRSEVHTILSTVATEAVQRARHRALASANPDAEVARSLVTAAEEARRRGARGLAAELYLLAADRMPAELDAERLEWLVAAAEVGSAASRAEIVSRAADAVIATDSTPAHRVRARIALIDLSGQALADMDETFAAALADAADDPACSPAAAAAGLAGDGRRIRYAERRPRRRSSRVRAATPPRRRWRRRKGAGVARSGRRIHAGPRPHPALPPLDA
jgi:hypothetical protein